ncbi:hypothetical protein [Streptomyces kebangsaanensis]|uniref:hypothetical protein n=1 Tax=Streptomyces kebangsaanensis TaxID=864058 RepID=UPI00093F42A6|nr:hypothetical protein [Streptomyces kebangsaanensis]
MLRKAYVPGAAALLVALLAGCTGGSPGDDQADNANPGGTGTAEPAAQPGKYRTLPEACGAVSHGTLDSLLPGIKQIMDVDQRDKAYEGQATLTYDTDRKTGCRWKVESADATDHLHVEFERVVSYDNTVSDDSQAESVFATKQAAAGLPEPAATGSSGANSGANSGTNGTPSSSTSSPSSPSSASSGVTPSDLQPGALSDLGDEAFLDDSLGSSGSTVQQRTVTVAFRTSNVIVTIEYMEQPASVGTVPDSEEMQGRARELAERLADSLGG